MSVLNQMLRNLEQRGAHLPSGAVQARFDSAPQALGIGAASARLDSARAPFAAATPVAPPAQSSARRKLAWLSVALAVAAFAGTDAWLQSRVAAAAKAPVPLGARSVGQAANVISSATVAAAYATENTAATAPVQVAANVVPSSAVADVVNDAATHMVNDAVKPSSSSTARVAAADAPSPTAARSTPKVEAKAPHAPTATPKQLAALAPARPAAAEATSQAAPEEAPTASITPSTSTRQPDAALRRAADLIARGRTYEATSVLKQILREAPRHDAARRTLAALQAEGGMQEAALATLLEGAALDPQHYAAPAAQLQAQLGDRAGALRTLARVAEADRTGAHYALAGGIALQSGNAALAREAYTRATQAPAIDPVWWVGLALAEEALGDLAAASDALARAASAPALPRDVRSFVAQRQASLRAVAP